MSQLDLDIRGFEPSDREAIHAIRMAAFAPVYASFRRMVGPAIAATSFHNAEPEQGQWLDTMCEPGSGHVVRVAVTKTDGQLVGFCTHAVDATKRIGEIGQNAVRPDFTGQGVGSALYDDALAAMRRAEMRVAIVSTGGDYSHAPARAAYLKAGFEASIPMVQLSRVL